MNCLVRKKGLEPLRPFGHQLLRLARLPIPPLPRGAISIQRESLAARLPAFVNFCFGDKPEPTAFAVSKRSCAVGPRNDTVALVWGPPVLIAHNSEAKNGVLQQVRIGSTTRRGILS
jgi:hypothetical protein